MPLSLLGSWLDAMFHLLKLWPKEQLSILDGDMFTTYLWNAHAVFEIRLRVILVSSNSMNSDFIYRDLLKRKSLSQIM